MQDHVSDLSETNQELLTTIESQRVEIGLLREKIRHLEPEIKRLSAERDHFIRVNAGIAAKVEDAGKIALNIITFVRDAAFAKAPEIASPVQDTQLSAADEAALANLTQRLAPRGNGSNGRAVIDAE